MEKVLFPDTSTKSLKNEYVYGALSNFEIYDEIGKGVFSVVFKAQCILNGKFVALKKIQISDAKNSQAISDCKKEINLLQRLDHPSVVKYLASFTDRNELYIVLELADAGDLSTKIKYFKEQTGLIPEKRIWKYFLEVCAAIKHMHLNRVMHRDIKPENIFVTAEDKVKLGDLNTGRFLSSDTTSTNTFAGTPCYMPPEKIKRQGYNFKSEIWSLGCLLYEMATLQPPFYDESLDLPKLVRKLEVCQYPPIPPGIYSIQLKNLVAACINPNPDERPDIELVYTTALAMATLPSPP